MINKRGRMTLGGLFIAVLMTLMMFYGTYEYASSNFATADIGVPEVYNNSNNTLKIAENNLDSNITAVRTAVTEISEAPLDFVNVAWNGLTGIAASIQVLFGMISITTEIFNAIVPGLSFLPTFVKVLIEMMLVIIITLILLGAFKGESKT